MTRSTNVIWIALVIAAFQGFGRGVKQENVTIGTNCGMDLFMIGFVADCESKRIELIFGKSGASTKIFATAVHSLNQPASHLTNSKTGRAIYNKTDVVRLFMFGEYDCSLQPDDAFPLAFARL